MICTALEISAREYSSAAELMAAAQERRKRLANPARKPRNAVPQLTYSREAEERARANAEALKPLRKKEAIRFDQHVRDYAPYRSGHGRDWRAFIALRAADFSLTYQEVVSRSQAKAIVHARAVIMYEIHKTGLKSLPEIGRMFGRDHTSILWAINRVKADNGDIEAQRKAGLKRERSRKCYVDSRKKK